MEPVSPNNSIVTVESIIEALPVTTEELHDRRKMVRLFYRLAILVVTTMLTSLSLYIIRSA